MDIINGSEGNFEELCDKIGDIIGGVTMNNKLREIGQEINTQNNRAMSDPIFMVQQKRRIWGMHEDWSDSWRWVDEDAQEVDDQYREDYQDIVEFTRLYYQDIWGAVQPFFTEKAAQMYIDSNKHNLNNPKIYVFSAYRNQEWQDIRNYLKELT